MHMLFFLVVLPVKSEYLEVKASDRDRKVLSDRRYAFIWCIHVAVLACSAHWSMAYSRCGGGVASAHSQAPAQPLAHSLFPVLRDGGENRKNESEKAHGSR